MKYRCPHCLEDFTAEEWNKHTVKELISIEDYDIIKIEEKEEESFYFCPNPKCDYHEIEIDRTDIIEID